MTNENEKDIVKYDEKWWLLESVSEKGMATLYRNGQPALVPESEIEYDKKRKNEQDNFMEWRKEEEREKYVVKTVTYNNSPWIVKEVFQKNTQEEFDYWTENPNGKLQVVVNKDIELLD